MSRRLASLHLVAALAGIAGLAATANEQYEAEALPKPAPAEPRPQSMATKTRRQQKTEAAQAKRDRRNAKRLAKKGGARGER